MKPDFCCSALSGITISSFTATRGRCCSTTHKARRSKSGKGPCSCHSQDDPALLCEPVHIAEFLRLSGEKRSQSANCSNKTHLNSYPLLASDPDSFENEAQLTSSKEQGQRGEMNTEVKNFCSVLIQTQGLNYVPPAGLGLTMQNKLPSNSQKPTCLRLPSAGSSDEFHLSQMRLRIRMQ